MNEQIKKVGTFLNPLNPLGGLAGRVIAPVLLIAATLFTVPGSPLNIAGMIDGVDVSVYGGRITQQQWEGTGRRVAVVGAWHGLSGNPYAEDNLRDARAAGKITATYIAISPSRDARSQVDLGKQYVGSEWDNLNFVAVDIEIDGNTVQHAIDAMQRVRELGQRPIIYTAGWFWRGHMGNPCIPGGALLWNAYYDYDPDVDYDGYGCFTLVGEQYIGTTDLNGISVDENVFDETFILAGVKVSEPAPTPAELPPVGGAASWRPPLVRLDGTVDVYGVFGGWRISLCNEDVFGLSGFRWEEVQVVQQDSPLWKLPAMSCK